jgi:hypothetical protein
VTYDETIGETEDWFGNQNLAIGSSNRLKTRTQDDGESLQECATAIEQATHCAFPAWYDNHISRGPGKAFINGIRGWNIKWQLRLGGKRTLEVLRQTLGLEVIKVTDGSSIRPQKANDRALWRSRPPSQTEDETTESLCAGAVGAPATSGSSPHKPEEERAIHLWATWDEQP